MSEKKSNGCAVSEKATAAMVARNSARDDLIIIRDALMSAPSRGIGPDEPEGSVTIQISYTLARQWATSLGRASRLI